MSPLLSIPQNFRITNREKQKKWKTKLIKDGATSHFYISHLEQSANWSPQACPPQSFKLSK